MSCDLLRADVLQAFLLHQRFIGDLMLLVNGLDQRSMDVNRLSYGCPLLLEGPRFVELKQFHDIFSLGQDRWLMVAPCRMFYHGSHVISLELLFHILVGRARIQGSSRSQTC